MPTSRRSFDHVKGILAKLDRSIDDARKRRLTVDEPEEDRSIGVSETDEARPGRAKPMQRESYFKSPMQPRRINEQWPRTHGNN